MRILVEHGSSHFNNLGDIAMLQVAVKRLHSLWPDATLLVVTTAPASMKRHISIGDPVSIGYPASWMGIRQLITRKVPRLPHSWWVRLETSLSWCMPAPFRGVLAEAVESSDLVVHAGSGILADPFAPAALRRLTLFKRAIRREKPTAFFGQGIGPIQIRLLRREVVAVLSRAGLVSLRDRASARWLAQATKMAMELFPVTGDDALHLTHASHPPEARQAVGFNLRFSSYSGLDEHSMGLRESLAAAISSTRQDVLPFAIHESDADNTRRWLRHAGIDRVLPAHEFTVPGVLQAIGRCRIVVTSSYHGAVLALGQGIPALCLSRSDYYRQKFTGLRELFPESCRVADLTDVAALGSLPRWAEEMWDKAEELRPNALARAQSQVKRSQDVYRVWADQIHTA